MNRLFLFLPLALFAVMAAYFALGLRENPGEIPSQLIDRELPVFDLPPIQGHETGLASEDLAGEVSLLNVRLLVSALCNRAPDADADQPLGRGADLWH